MQPSQGIVTLCRSHRALTPFRGIQGTQGISALGQWIPDLPLHEGAQLGPILTAGRCNSPRPYTKFHRQTRVKSGEPLPNPITMLGNRSAQDSDGSEPRHISQWKALRQRKAIKYFTPGIRSPAP